MLLMDLYLRISPIPYGTSDFLLNLVLPVSCVLVLLSAGHILFVKAAIRWQPFTQACYVLSVFIVQCSIIVGFYYPYYLLYVLYIGPIILSVIYMDKKIINFTCIACIIAYIITLIGFILPLGNPDKIGWSPNRLFTAFTLLICGYIIARIIFVRISEAVDIAVTLSFEKERLRRELDRDPFTRLFNHIAFYGHLDNHILRAQSEQLVFSLVIMDIDDFKRINDNFGHDIGDVVLLKLVETITGEIGEKDLAFRFGGEEFVVLCADNLNSAYQLAERIRKRFGAHVFMQLDSNNVTVSIGVCEYDNSFGGRREFFSAADKALYRAKKEGKNKTIATEGIYEISV
ncbi:MAG: GGDEF domain-containing protein [Clostridiales bacterium]|nr:GGDEF domain-containing protein [Clostridiales bacterium]